MSLQTAVEFLASPLVAARAPVAGTVPIGGVTIAAPTEAELEAAGAETAPFYVVRGRLSFANAGAGTYEIQADVNSTGVTPTLPAGSGPGVQRSVTTAADPNFEFRIPIGQDVTLVPVVGDVATATTEDVIYEVLVPVLP